ncbi:479_t:CDS:10 [Dentiscutata heterogama]|uniref:479_t:CDS:1 n=1 Tax=Dentiscutata heterogama TaxID=1316150 RepID=A0ACA9KAK6_9GLOM|nr:479_t:CDS:10 [Dentiscutata heterogama]
MMLVRLNSPLTRTFSSTLYKKSSNKYQKIASLLQKRAIVTHMETNHQKTFSNQNNIPRLPIPTLKETAERYKKSLLPLLSTSDYNRAANAVDEFMKEGGFAEVLQKRLHDVDKSEKYNWLETIWLNKAYLEWRDPSLINVNWWVEFNDPATGILKNPPPKGQISELQIDRAAGLVSNLLTFNDMVNNELLPPEKTRQGPLCMDQYTKQFGATRIVDSPSDRVITTWPATAKHIIVIFRDQIFKVQVLGGGGERIPIKEIKRQLQSIVDQVNNTTELQPPIGLLTGEHRDTWATARKKLESSSAENKISFEAIDTSLFCIALDDYPTDTDIDISHHNFFHAYNGRNRWFDKALQIVVANNGRAGVNGEHSPSDAVIPGTIFDYIIKNEPAQDPQNTSPIELPPPQHLKWIVDGSIMNTIQQAQINIQAAIDNVDSVLLHYNEYGSDWLKNVKVSPDAFVQMAIQLAYYKHYREPCPTYESASTRGFLHGRTETVRTCSVDTVAFTKAFCDPNVRKDEKISLLTKAIKSHIEYMISATNGRGVDRHLLGLRCQIRDEEEKSKATLFTDPSYVQSMYFKLSSSNMSPGLGFHCGFGAVVPDGYGICYVIGKDKLKLSISSYKKCKETDSTIFRKVLKESLDELREILS